METKRVHEVMIPLARYPTVYEDQSLREAVAILDESSLEQEGRKSIPRVLLVLNRANELTGVARRRDLLRGLEPEFLLHHPIADRKALFDIKIDRSLPEMSYDRMVKGVVQRSSRPVSEVMRTVETTVDSDDHILTAIYELVDQNLSLLPVRQGESVVGVVRSVELLHEVALLLDEHPVAT